MAQPPRSIDDIDFDNLTAEDIAWCNEQLDNPGESFGEQLPPPTPARWRDLARNVMLAWGGRLGDPSAPCPKIGRFDAEDMLGVGGYGCVFKVRDPDLDRPAALKLCITPRKGAEDSLMSEAKILAKLNHPNIVTVYEVSRHDMDLFFVMQLVEGPTIYRYVTKSKVPPGWEELVELFCTVGLAIAVAHDVGIIHGDIKPSNILLDLETKTPYIADFGLARACDVTPDQEQTFGTLPYMGPELLRGGASDERSDQYAFCVALWECIDGGIPPFGGRDAEDFLIEIGEDMPTVINKAVPQRIRDVLRRGMMKEASERWLNMRELVYQLRLALGPRLVEREPSGPRSRSKNIGLIMLVVALAVGLLIQSSSTSQPRASLSSNRGGLEQAAPAEPSNDDFVEDHEDADGLVAQGCVMSTWKPSAGAKTVCASIREKKFEHANELWIAAHDKANPRTADEWATLIHDSLSIAETFLAEEQRVNAGTWRHIACIDYRSARDSADKTKAEELISPAFEGIPCD